MITRTRKTNKADIKKLRDYNEEKMFTTYRTFYKVYKKCPKRPASLQPLKGPGKTSMITAINNHTANTKTALNTFYSTFYNSPKDGGNTEYNNNLNLTKKKFFGMDGKTPLSNFNTATQYTLFSNTDANQTRGRDYKEEDEEILKNAFLNNNSKTKLLDKDTMNEILEQYGITKQVTDDEKMFIASILRGKNGNKDIYFSGRNYDFNSAYKAYKKIKVNYQLARKVEEIRKNRQYQLYENEFEQIAERRIRTAKMPKIRIVSKQGAKIAETYSQKMAEMINNEQNNLGKRDSYNPNKERIINLYQEGNLKLTREEMMKEIQVMVRYIGMNYHPPTRSQFGMAFGDGRIYIYGGLGGRKLGDVWSIDLMNKKGFVWKKLFDTPYKPKKRLVYNRDKSVNTTNTGGESKRQYTEVSEYMSSDSEENSKKEFVPSERYGHTLHYYGLKLYVIGGFFQNWKNANSDEIVVVYDITKNKWIKETPVASSLIKSRSDSLESLSRESSEDKAAVIKAPCLRRNHTSLAIGSTILLYGGIGQNENYLSDLWVYNIKTREWHEPEIRGRIPPQLAYHCSTLALEKEQLYNPSLTIYKVPESQRKTIALMKCEGVFFFGGMNSNRIPTNLFFLMHIGKKYIDFEIPKTHGKPPPPRISSSMDFYCNLNLIIIYGGRNDLIEHSYLNDFWVLDLETLNWTQCEYYKEVPVERAEHQSFIYANRLLILGGVGSEMMNFDFQVTNVDFI